MKIKTAQNNPQQSSKRIEEPNRSTKFQGFSSPNYTQVPDEFFDKVAPFLSEAQLKVMLYLIRRIFGFKKQADNISLSQMLNGIVTKSGGRLDYGAGVKKKALLNALKWLEENRYIIRSRNKSQKRGDEATTFSLPIANSVPQVSQRHQGGGIPKTPHKKQYYKKQKYINSTTKNLGSEKHQSRGGGLKRISDLLPTPNLNPSQKSSDRLKEPSTPGNHQRPSPTKTTSKKRPTVPYGNKKLIVFTNQISSEFLDTQHELENIGQVHNIFKAVQVRGRDEIDLLSFMYDARKQTQQYLPTIKGSAMAYFFKVLRDKARIDDGGHIPPPVFSKNLKIAPLGAFR